MDLVGAKSTAIKVNGEDGGRKRATFLVIIRKSCGGDAEGLERKKKR